MALFTLNSVRKDFGIKELLRNASFSLEEGDKVGIIGTNGSGKSTLLKMIAGPEPIDGGDLWVSSGARIIYLPQQPEMDPEHTVLEQVFAAAGEKMRLIRAYEELSHRLAHQGGDPSLLSQLASISERIEVESAWDLETQAKTILSRLGIADFQARVGDLSGGYRKRIAIASALLAEPDALLMDEPTNHLDAESVEWLQDYLNRFAGAVLLITHDRYFLDRVTQRILEIDRGDLYAYSGNYSYYLEKKAAAEAVEKGSQRKYANLLRRELEWLKRGAKARSTKQKARKQRIEDLQNQEFKQALGQVDIATAGRRIGKKVIELEGIHKSYGDQLLIQDFTYTFAPDDRVGIIGPNGAGKSTLMNIIIGKLAPDAGRVEIGPTIHIGYFDQHSDDLSLNPDQRVIEYLKEVAELVKTADGRRSPHRKCWSAFSFPPINNMPHSTSGGERRRLFLLRVLMQAPNVLILDEPTNDLDVQTLAVLEDYLEEFNGCVIVVSHDRYFLDRTVNRIFAFEGSGQIRQYPGNYSVYLEHKQRQESEIKSARPESVPLIPQPEKELDRIPQSRKLSFKEKREYEQLESQIPQMEAEKAEIEQILYRNPPSGYSEVQKLAQKLADLTAAIDSGTARWLELAERHLN